MSSSFPSIRKFSLITCVVIFALIGYAVPFEQKVTEAQLRYIILDINPDISPNRLSQLLKCTKETRYIQRSLECEMTINEILLREKWQTYEGPCDVTDEENKLLLNSPLVEIQNPNRTRDEIDREYIVWQDELIHLEKKFCNPFKHLYCAPDKKCRCWPTLKFDVDQCIAKDGSYCYPPNFPFPTRFFDPYTRAHVEVPSPKCVDSMGAIGKCNNDLDFFSAAVCEASGVTTVYQKANSEFQAHYLSSTTLLKLGDTCDYNAHQSLLASPEAEWQNLELRVQILGDLTAAKPKLCDPYKFLRCGQMSKQCECMPPTTWTAVPGEPDGGYCGVLSPDEYCKWSQDVSDRTSVMPKKYKSTLRHYYEHEAGKTSCPSSTHKCHRDLTLHPEPFCECIETHKLGKTCIPLSRFFPKYSHRLLPTDEPDVEERARVFLNFNKLASIFEQMFSLGEGEPCTVSPDAEFESRGLIDRIDELEETSSLNRVHFIQLTQDVTKFLKDHAGVKFCQIEFYPRGDEKMWLPRNSRTMHFLTCIPNPDPRANSGKNTVCSVISNQEYLFKLVDRLGDVYTLDAGQPCQTDIVVTIEENLEKERHNNFSTEEQTFEFLFALVKTFREDNQQFCNKTAGLECVFANKRDTEGTCMVKVKVSRTDERDLDINFRRTSPAANKSSGSKFMDFVLFYPMLFVYTMLC